LESSTKDVEVDIGANFDFDCKAQGYPKPNISWIRADSKPLHGGFARHNVKICNIFFLVKEHKFNIMNYYNEGRSAEN
jgi:hypothetical protein